MREADVVEERLGAPGDADQTSIVLRAQRGLRRARQVSTAEAALVGACDSELTFGQIVDALGELLGQDAADLESTLDPFARAMIRDGILEVPR